MLILAIDTATEVATSALVEDGEVLGERSSRASTVLEDVDALLRQGGRHAGRHRRDSPSASARGASPACGSGSRPRAGSRSRSTCRSAGVSTLDALAAGAPGAVPVIDAHAARCSCSSTASHAASPRPTLDVEPGRGVRRRRRASLPRPARGGRRCRPARRQRAAPSARAVPRRAGGLGRAGRARRAALPPRCPTPSRRSHDRAPPRSPLRDLTAIEEIEQRVVPDAVVALDVRGRAREAVLDLPRRVRRAGSSSATSSSPATSTPGT